MLLVISSRLLLHLLGVLGLVGIECLLLVIHLLIIVDRRKLLLLLTVTFLSHKSLRFRLGKVPTIFLFFVILLRFMRRLLVILIFLGGKVPVYLSLLLRLLLGRVVEIEIRLLLLLLRLRVHRPAIHLNARLLLDS